LDPETILEKLKKTKADAKVAGVIQDIDSIQVSSTAVIETQIDRASKPMGISGDVFDLDLISP
jgi:hypothetical protein